MKNVSQRVDSFFQCFIQMLHKVLKIKDNVSPRCNKAKHISNPTNSAFFTINIMLNIKILQLREFDFFFINKEIFATTYIESFARQQPMQPTRNINMDKETS